MYKLYDFINNNLSKNLLLKDIKDSLYIYFDMETIKYCMSKVLFNCNKYNRIKLYDYSNDLFEMVLICWDINSETKIHDHPEKGCALYLIDGILEEQQYNDSLELCKTTYFNKKNTSYMENSMGYHKIRCCEKAISLHIYSPPNHKMRILN